MKCTEIIPFLEQVRKVDMLDGVTIPRSEKVKDEIVLYGNDTELVYCSAALINQVSPCLGASHTENLHHTLPRFHL